jgi:hypothetical protein
MGVMNHLTEQELQQMADGLTFADQQEKRMHLDQCPDCKRIFHFYETLRQAVKTENRFQLSPQFSSRVAGIILSEKERQSRLTEILLTGGCIIFGLIISLFYLNRNGILSRWSDTLSRNVIPEFTFNSVQPFVFVIYILALLVFFQAADKLLVHRKFRIH